MGAERPPLDPLTAENTGPALIIVVDALVTLSVFTTVIRFSLSAARNVPLGSDDQVYLLANVFAVISSILWHLAVTAGLGKRTSALSPSNLDMFFKFEYTAQLVETAAMFCSKAAFALLVNRVVPWRRNSKTVVLLAATAWAVFSVFALAFQCPLPRPWMFEPAQCPTHGKLLYPIVAFNALTDVVLAAWIIPVVLRLQTDRRSRIAVIVLFGLRACILAPTIAEVGMLHIFLNDDDQSRVTVNRAILNQVIVYTSLIAAAIPRTNQLLSRLHTDLHAAVLADFEMVNDKPTTSKKPDTAIGLVPPSETVLSTSVFSSTTDAQFEKLDQSHPSIQIQRDIFVVQQNRGAGTNAAEHYNEFAS